MEDKVQPKKRILSQEGKIQDLGKYRMDNAPTLSFHQPQDREDHHVTHSHVSGGNLVPSVSTAESGDTKLTQQTGEEGTRRPITKEQLRKEANIEAFDRLIGRRTVNTIDEMRNHENLIVTAIHQARGGPRRKRKESDASRQKPKRTYYQQIVLLCNREEEHTFHITQNWDGLKELEGHLRVYFTVSSAVTSCLLNEELLYLRNESSVKPGSIIDPETTSITSTVFTAVILSFSSLGIVTSVLLLYGLYRDQRLLLVPWIFAVVGFIIVDIVHCFYMILVHAISVNPAIAILVTIDFFLNALNVYALLCVISQYQELKCGRGRAEDDHSNRIPSIHYSTQPTATTYLSARKTVNYTEAHPSPTQSPTGTGPHTSLGTEEPSPNILNRGPRKSVKFPDSPTHNGGHTDGWSMNMISTTFNHINF